ncbi:unnamed protein product [Phytophthora lilii]|uniref:Unnamed protein product n=1 Tax=Phytophthora lilii TaxID=2077276 RepID=A0A9W6TQ72_9STRA|nr:unnamed protein product [Phytophthora lilii]
MNANIAGGPSIIFNRYAKRNETKIRGGKLCKKVIGYDANALYLWALGNDMPCGRLTTNSRLMAALSRTSLLIRFSDSLNAIFNPQIILKTTSVR